MKVKNMFWGLMAAAWALTACTQEELVGEQPGAQEEGVEVSEITVKMPEFEAEDGTRVTPDYPSMKLSWEDNDQVGIHYQKDEESSVCIYNMKEKSEDGKTGLFSNIGFKLMPGEKYTVLYPYDKWDVEYSGYVTRFVANYQTENKWQTQLGGLNEKDHLRDYAFLYGEMIVDNNGKGTVQLEPMGAYLRLNVAPLYNSRYTNMYVEFYSYGMIDLPATSARYVYSRYSTDITYSNYQLKMQLGNEYGLGVSSGGFYAHMMVPEQSSVNRMVVKLEDAEGRIYTSEFIDIPNSIQRGKAYSLFAKNFSVDGLEDNQLHGHEFVDLGITDSKGNPVYWATTNVGAAEPGNTGNFYSWGSTEPLGYYTSNGSWVWSEGKSDAGYGISNYKWMDGWGDLRDKYRHKYEFETDDDAASAVWGRGWTTPTADDYKALIENCYWQYEEDWSTGVSVKGFTAYKPKGEEDRGKIVGKNAPADKGPKYSYGHNCPYIFFPEVGFWNTTEYSGYQGMSYYLTKNREGELKRVKLFRSDYESAGSAMVIAVESYNLYNGYAVRAVYKPKVDEF